MSAVVSTREFFPLYGITFLQVLSGFVWVTVSQDIQKIPLRFDNLIDLINLIARSVQMSHCMRWIPEFCWIRCLGIILIVNFTLFLYHL